MGKTGKFVATVVAAVALTTAGALPAVAASRTADSRTAQSRTVVDFRLGR